MYVTNSKCVFHSWPIHTDDIASWKWQKEEEERGGKVQIWRCRLSEGLNLKELNSYECELCLWACRRTSPIGESFSFLNFSLQIGKYDIFPARYPHVPATLLKEKRWFDMLYHNIQHSFKVVVSNKLHSTLN